MEYKSVVRCLTTAALAGALWVLPAAPQSDNTRANKGQETTADQAKNSTVDRDLMQKVRHAIVSDKSLSTYAHNVKVIAQGGKVTLKGPVRSDEEKSAVESKATEVAGAGNVVNDLTVKASRKKTSQ
jgi:osmotically-inducible protein OsmY